MNCSQGIHADKQRVTAEIGVPEEVARVLVTGTLARIRMTVLMN